MSAPTLATSASPTGHDGSCDRGTGPWLLRKSGRQAPRAAGRRCADRGPPSVRLRAQAGARRDHRRSSVVDRVDDLAGVDSLQVDRRDPEMGMPELPLNNRQRDPFVRHLDRMSMPELVRRKPPPHPKPAWRAAEARRGQRSLTTRGRASGRQGCRTAVRSGAGRGARSSEQHAPKPSRPFRPSGAYRPSRHEPALSRSSSRGRSR
jgi:hypothetical protein